jgi:hypothetical protein
MDIFTENSLLLDDQSPLFTRNYPYSQGIVLIFKKQFLFSKKIKPIKNREVQTLAIN